MVCVRHCCQFSVKTTMTTPICPRAALALMGQCLIISGQIWHHSSSDNTNYRAPISFEQRVSLALYYLCTGRFNKSLNVASIASISSISKIVSETGSATLEVWRDEVLRSPETEQQWRAISDCFLDHWNFPHTLGALDGKQIRIQKPANSGNNFFNYKKYFSIFFLAMVDAELRFTYMEVGSEGSCSDATVQ